MSLVADATSFFNSYNTTFYYPFNNGTAVWAMNNYHTNATNSLPSQSALWTEVETLEVAEDYAEYIGRTPESLYFVDTLISGVNLVVSQTQDFASWDAFNDDVMWAVITLNRAYSLTGNVDYLNQAQQQFDTVYARAYDTVLGGGLYWKTDNASKNACVNGPAAIAAQLLANNGRGEGYHQKAVKIYGWLRDTLFDNTTGAIHDNIQVDGTVATFSLSYNQGTFIGAATLLANGDQNSGYLEDAGLAMNFTRFNLTHPGTDILNDESSDPNAGDNPGFKGIFTRWAAKYIQTSGEAYHKDFLVSNANEVWKMKNAQGVTWSDWTTKTPDSVNGTVIESWGASAALSAVIAGSVISKS